MQKNDWAREMPEVPKAVHEAVLDALEKIEKKSEEKTREEKIKEDMLQATVKKAGRGSEGETETITEEKAVRIAGEKTRRSAMRKARKGHGRRKILAVAAAAAALMGTTVLAAELIWNSRVAEAFQNPSRELQQKTIDNGVAVLPDVSVTDQGITVTAVQALQDENRIYLLFRVEAEEAVIDDNSGFEGWTLQEEQNDDIFGSMSAWFLKVEDGQPHQEGYYIIDALKNENTDREEEVLQVNLSDFSYYTYENYDKTSGAGEQTGHRIAGSWQLEIALTDVSSLSRVVQIDRDMECRGTAVTVNYVKISPLSLTISYEDADVRQIPANEDDTITELFEVKLGFMDGTVEEQGYAGTTSRTTEDGQCLIRICLTRVVDLEQLKTVILGDGTIFADVE